MVHTWWMKIAYDYCVQRFTSTKSQHKTDLTKTHQQGNPSPEMVLNWPRVKKAIKPSVQAVWHGMFSVSKRALPTYYLEAVSRKRSELSWIGLEGIRRPRKIEALSRSHVSRDIKGLKDIIKSLTLTSRCSVLT